MVALLRTITFKLKFLTGGQLISNVFGRNKIFDYSEGEITSQYFVKDPREISHALQSQCFWAIHDFFIQVEVKTPKVRKQCVSGYSDEDKPF